MLATIRRHGVKIFVFAINLILAAVAVFIIREKDQARLLEKAQDEKENLEKAQAEQEPAQSFENSVDFENQSQTDGNAENVPEQAEAPSQTPPAAPAEVVPIPPPAKIDPIPIPAPVPKKKPADTKTKTS